MCWNKEISLNTFLFSSFVLLLVIYNNTYTQYKIEELDNLWAYLFLMSFILMQLIEYFIWKNINDPLYNKIFTSLVICLLFLQPIASIMLLTNNIIRSYMLSLYLIFSIPFGIYIYNYRFIKLHTNSSISGLGHLQWNILDKSVWSQIIKIVWFIFFLSPLFYQGYTYGFLFGVLTLLFAIYNYSKDKSVESMWCWVVNSIMIFYAGYLLLYLPFHK